MHDCCRVIASTAECEVVRRLCGSCSPVVAVKLSAVIGGVARLDPAPKRGGVNPSDVVPNV
jgi:hypothetical protein